jgi:hypothetical protein
MHDADTTANPLRRKRWNPYVVGVLIGVLSWITFLTMDKALGTSSSMVHVAGLVETVAGKGASVMGPDANAYYAKEITEKTPMFDWQVLLVIGVFIGALVSSRLSGDRTTECVPGLWTWRFGPGKAGRYAAAFIGGAIMLFGARMAGGCTSGHGISGGLQLAVSSWAFFIAMFASGVATAFGLFGKGGRHHVV